MSIQTWSDCRKTLIRATDLNPILNHVGVWKQYFIVSFQRWLHVVLVPSVLEQWDHRAGSTRRAWISSRNSMCPLTRLSPGGKKERSSRGVIGHPKIPVSPAFGFSEKGIYMYRTYSMFCLNLFQLGEAERNPHTRRVAYHRRELPQGNSYHPLHIGLSRSISQRDLGTAASRRSNDFLAQPIDPLTPPSRVIGTYHGNLIDDQNLCLLPRF